MLGVSNNFLKVVAPTILELFCKVVICSSSYVILQINLNFVVVPTLFYKKSKFVIVPTLEVQLL
ncbi:conserved hypothetical protein [Leptospira interrogans serovar Manilae]|uniref:Uncharacterized protein n=1 Tax=Leptospira interrogans serovar Manilae TaxID=214675 RepID=A0AAQ1P1F5_LEPIR|nr:conserved hypothetical protein [Leptospira interrogans serovar Manilae]